MRLFNRAAVVLSFAGVSLVACRTASSSASLKDDVPATGPQASSATGAQPPTETCAYTVGGQPFLNTSLGVLGPGQYANTLVLLGMNGGPSQSISVAPVPPLPGEQARFRLDANGTSAFDTLIFLTPGPTDKVLKTQILMRPNAVAAILQGTCKYSDH